MKRLLCLLFTVALCLGAVPLGVGGLSVNGTSEAVMGTEINHLYRPELEGLLKGCFYNNTIPFYNNDVFYNVSDNAHRMHGRVVESYLFQNEDGSYTRVEQKIHTTVLQSAVLPGNSDLSVINGTPQVVVETYSGDFKLKSSLTLETELPMFGGFFKGTEYNFVVFGQENTEADTSKEVIRVVKYSKSWKRLGACSLYGAYTATPFKAGSLRMAEANGTLFVHTCHLMDNGHQANMSIAVDAAQMTVTEVKRDVGYINTGYLSHSFDQHIVTDGKTVYRVDLNDALHRGVTLTAFDVGSRMTKNVFGMVAYEIKHGSYGENYTGVSVGGVEISNDKVVIAINSEDQSDTNAFKSDVRNVYVVTASTAAESSKATLITDYPTSGKVTALTPQMVKLSENRFLLMWEEYNRDTGTFVTCITTVDQNGSLCTDIFRTSLRLSDCKPILCKDGLVRWYVSYGDKTEVYAINPSNPKPPLDRGDVNGDGYVDSLDAAMVLKYDAGLIELTAKQYPMADVNNDGVANNIDAALILKYDAGLISGFYY